jgi:hypothetical protein
MKVLGASVSRRLVIVLALSAVDVLLFLFVSIAWFLCFRALRHFIATTLRFDVDSGGNRSLTPRWPKRRWEIGLWGLSNTMLIGIAIFALFYVNRSLVAILGS